MEQGRFYNIEWLGIIEYKLEHSTIILYNQALCSGSIAICGMRNKNIVAKSFAIHVLYIFFISLHVLFYQVISNKGL